MDAEPFTIAEAALAERLGVSRENLREIRTILLNAEKDWAMRKNAVVYFTTGVEAVCAELKCSVPTDLQNAPQKKDGEPQTVFVRRAARHNPHVLFATEKKDDAEGAEIAVRVRNAALFVPGQEIRVTLAGAGLASLHGPQPRQRGRLLKRRA